MTPILSILICTIKSRQLLCGRLLGILRPQRCPEVEILTEEDDGDTTIGAKRNVLLDRAQGRYLCFIDDDDTVSDDYVASLVSGLSTHKDQGGPDCVGFRAKWYEDGKHTADTSYSLSNDPKCREVDRGSYFQIERLPCHLTPVRAEFAKAVGFQPWNFGEDREYASKLRPYLSREVFIDKVLYHYWLRNRDARAHEKVHPERWTGDSNIRIERSLAAALNRRNNTVPAVTAG